MQARRVRMSSKGQIVVPLEARERCGWGEGTVLEIVETTRGVLLRRPEAASTASIDALIGCIPYRGRRHSVAEMERAVLAEARRRGAR